MWIYGMADEERGDCKKINSERKSWYTEFGFSFGTPFKLILACSCGLETK